MMAGEFQADPAVREASCTDKNLTQPVERWCRCANWRHNGAWAPLQEDYETTVDKTDESGAVIYKKDANGADLLENGAKVPEKVMGKRPVQQKDAAGNLLVDVNGNPKYTMVYTEANCDYGLDANGAKIPIPAYETNWE